ncbi:DNA-3-methyladenine glycosylase family protein [Streptomyces rapamycinicus]|uniref:DNA-3-methyladenine glycosylase II n=2 Tax=Streptomyces rapamycinicus TaxID=1226757 RepID=A0A0A0NM80_STRRN|nr:DNA-3-methyladenine glycosylase [Streptomyces rapamycinicus]AGP55460.1 iron-sulfur cluster assembly protein HesB [Streptomyces rapamycinicus NRRL 5491]MBB4783019.1 DNA-3-methyladenine glycosylase II [Streptomyces rapamycinicus]RLV81506.1 iron-sulfur cluster assembly protein HesB [Streptomyces rapamycinicus NRRL 5491]UTO63465.1 DNA-3-methyladenine glycosylase [Streptomyces rapamycinicus]UTP31422.1 DNA-3-methyladenine glycosylase [Streptomyces rapamycinicus NRRL 5491]
MTAVALTPSGPFSLAAGVRFLEDFTPASYRGAADDVLRLAFPADDGHSTVAVAVRQEETAEGEAGSVRAEFTTYPDPDTPADPRSAGTGAGAVRAQLARVLSLDVDGSGFPGLAAADPVVAGLMADYPGLRPVCFHSPYEAAAWAIIGHRIRMTQAAAIKARIAERHGRRVRIEGRTLYAFPTPPALRAITRAPGLTEVKIERLHALAEAADAGELDAARLRSMPVDDALAALRDLPGIGPFSAELILIRGAGHPDVFPRHEPRLHAAMADAYGLGAAASGDIRQLAGIADRWQPYRSWIALLLRARAAHISGRGTSAIPVGAPAGAAPKLIGPPVSG